MPRRGAREYGHRRAHCDRGPCGAGVPERVSLRAGASSIIGLPVMDGYELARRFASSRGSQGQARRRDRLGRTDSSPFLSRRAASKAPLSSPSISNPARTSFGVHDDEAPGRVG